MNKKEMIDLIAEGAEIKKATAEKALSAFVEGIIESLKKEEKVTLVGFGSFTVTKRAARKGRNPRTGETIDIAASKAPRFTPSKELKKAVR